MSEKHSSVNTTTDHKTSGQRQEIASRIMAHLVTQHSTCVDLEEHAELAVTAADILLARLQQ